MQSKTDECRAAIRAGNYRAADQLLAELRTEVEEAWRAANAAERQSIASEVLELLSWARQTVLAKRAHTYKRLREMNRHTAYLARPALGRAYVELDG